MPYASLADFLEELERNGQLLRIEAEVDADLEIAEISRRVGASGPALLFPRVRGQNVPLLTNLWSSEERVCLALGVPSLAELADRWAEQLKPVSPGGWMDSLRRLPAVATAEKTAPRVVRNAACQQVVRLASDVDLGGLPLPRCWPQDAARGLSAAALLSQSADEDRRNLEMCAAEVLDRNHLAITWLPQRGVQQALAQSQRRGERLSVALLAGGHPLDPLAALAPLAAGADPWSLAGFLRGKAVDLVKCRTTDLEVPADAEIVIEGVIDPQSPLVTTSSAGNFAGRYGLGLDARVMQVTAITQRANPVCMAMLPGAPPHELAVLRRALQRIFLPLVQGLLPEVLDYDFPAAAGGQNICIVAMRKTYAGQARRVAGALWGMELWMFNRLLVLVDEQVDVRDMGQVLRQLGTNVHPGRDVFYQQAPSQPDEYASPTALSGQTLGIDATDKLPGEHPRPWPAALAASKEVQDLVSSRWSEYGL